MEHHYPKVGAAAIALSFGLIMVSCIDDNYDLSDIDTTTELKVNDLTVPVNFKDIYLDKIIDLDDSDPDAIIKVREIDGKKYYYFSKRGEFDAEPKEVDKVEAPAPDHIESSRITITTAGAMAPARRRTQAEFQEYTVTEYHTDFSYHVGSDGNPKVDPAIKSIKNVTLDKDAPLFITMTFRSADIQAISSHVELYDLVVTVPESTTAHYGDIYSSEGKIVIPHLSSTTGEIELRLEVDAIDFVTATSPDGKAVVDGRFDFTENVGVASGRFLVYPIEGMSPADMPQEIEFTTNYDMSHFTVNHFSGFFDYAIDFDEIDPFELTDIPDFLAGAETNILLARPALTLQVNSPVAQYGLECLTGLTLRAERSNGKPSRTEILDQFTIGNESEQQFHILAPNEDAISDIEIPVGIPYNFTPFAGLSSVLSGEGLPDIVHVDFTSTANPDPRVVGAATDFPLGESLAQVHGDYEFSAPLALADGSVIVYSTTEDGWNDEDVDAIAVSKLKVTAKLSSDIPAAAKVYVRPVDVEGKRIPLTNADEAYATMPANANNYEISLELLGDIRHLDGVYIEAIVDDFNGSTLSPDFNIKVSDLRAAVTGTYTKKL